MFSMPHQITSFLETAMARFDCFGIVEGHCSPRDLDVRNSIQILIENSGSRPLDIFLECSSAALDIGLSTIRAFAESDYDYTNEEGIKNILSEDLCAVLESEIKDDEDIEDDSCLAAAIDRAVRRYNMDTLVCWGRITGTVNIFDIKQLKRFSSGGTVVKDYTSHLKSDIFKLIKERER